MILCEPSCELSRGTVTVTVEVYVLLCEAGYPLGERGEG